MFGMFGFGIIGITRDGFPGIPRDRLCLSCVCRAQAQRRLHPDVPKKPFRPERPERAPEVHVTLQDKHFAEDCKTDEKI